VPCYRPLAAYRTSSGLVRFGKPCGESLRLPCGQCIGCRLEKSRQWAVRCLAEAKCHEQNCFVTLTYDDGHLPELASLERNAFRLFMDRLRKRVGYGQVRYFHCGEYGETTGRPHYHALLFGIDFPDKVRYARLSDEPLWVSKMLEELWPQGSSTIGNVTFESAAYVARYVTKKITGERAREHYGGRLPEYATMSRRPGIGRGWFDQFANEVYPADSVISRGREAKPPRYFDGLLESASPIEMWAVRRAREAARDPENETEERLVVREVVTKSKLSLKRRSL